MKTFKIVVEFNSAPDFIPMAVAKAMAIEGIKAIPDSETIDDQGEYVFVLSDIEYTEEMATLQ